MTSTTKTSSGVALTGCIFAVLLWAPLVYWRAFVAVKLWSWFIAPLSPDLATPSVYAMAGIALVISAIWPYPSITKATAAENLGRAAVYPLMLLGFGALWHWLQWGMA